MDARLRVQFRYSDDPADRELALEALNEVGLSLQVLPDEPPPPPGAVGLGGGGSTLPVDLILQHGFNIADSVLATGLLVAIAKAFKRIKHRFGAAKLRVEQEDADGVMPDLTVTYFISLSALGGFEETALLEIARDYRRIDRETRKIRRRAARGERFDTVRIEIERHSTSWRVGRVEPDEIDPAFDPRG